LLLEERVEIGSFVDLELETAKKIGSLPLLQVVAGKPKGSVWLVRCVWLQKLSKKTVRLLLNRPRKKRKKKQLDSLPRSSGWLMRLWTWFHRLQNDRVSA